MIPITEIDAWMIWAATSVALTGIFQWLAGDHGDQSEEDVIEAHEFILAQLSDADSCRTIETITGKDLRSQLSLKQLEALHKEIEMLKMKGKRN
jgi:hypothetical protein